MTNSEDCASTLALAEAAELCKCSPHRLRKLAGMGAIPATKIGRRWVFPTRLLQEWIDDRSRANVTSSLYYGATRRATVTQTLMRVK